MAETGFQSRPARQHVGADVIWNETMGKWCMYMSINGANYRSVIVLLTADDIEGDWTYVARWSIPASNA